ncbi:glutathione synthetase ATP-binding domain-like protein [Teratosphaeria nubilosa]|uniref:Glutathione synthetase n=1 Tax=Teratosphaeria nubilosa TaxID=161662 RepID=A0A6G1LKY5_9PEZI|nr:glutathione synthetase ATP-binding domain-like protein [Teratosphaeria nubilosa]
MNELYMRVAADETWLLKVLAPLLEHDNFLSTLWDIYKQVKAAGVVQDIICGIFRCDYMLHGQSHADAALKQVEVNTTCLAGCCHASHVARMHHHLLQIRGADTSKLAYKPANIDNVVSCLAQAHKLYISSTPAELETTTSTCVLMPVQIRNVNTTDERPIDYALWDQGIPCYRCDWPDILAHTRLTPSRQLMYRHSLDSTMEFEVSVIYFRAGFEPFEYIRFPHGKETRLRLEMSRSIKAPDFLTHLSTLKIVQQALNDIGTLEVFLPDSNPEARSEGMATFMPMTPLDSEQGRSIASEAELAKHYVLKPNLEGGGNNIYRNDILAFVSELPVERLKHYTLMRLIEPPPTQSLLLAGEEMYDGEVISELGVLGTCIWRKTREGAVEVMRNEAAGWTFKTKPAAVDEMSVVKGYGCFDCPKFVDD